MKSQPENKLLSALRFISVAQKYNGSDIERFSMLVFREARAFNNVIAAGCPIEEDLRCCPQTQRLVAALEECKPGYQITLHQDQFLEVRSGEFVANVPLIDGGKLQWCVPDPLLITVDDRLRAALLAIYSIVNEKSDRVHEAAILLQANTCMSTNGRLILEAWHGWDLPPDILIPKSIVKAIDKAKKPLVGIGFGNASATFWFEDKSWLRTQRYLTKYPAHAMMNTATTLRPIHPTLFSAVHQLQAFSEDGQLYCWDNQASSHPFIKPNPFNAKIRAGIQGVQGSRVYPIDTLLAIHPFASQIDDTTIKNRSIVYGKRLVKTGTKKSDVLEVKMRGAFAHTIEEDEQPLPPVNYPPNMATWNTPMLAPGYCGEVSGTCQGKCDGTCLEIYNRNAQHITDEDIPF